MSTTHLRNIAIVAHVDHGKTTLVDELLKQSGTLDQRKSQGSERVMDSNALERERGITILAKNTALTWNGYRINVVDTPGHADFGGEVERILSMVDSVLLLVDAVDGPMPQTRFVTQKAFARGLAPLVVINKCDREGARPHWVLDQTFELFDRLGATDTQLDFPVVYTSAIKGYARHEPDGAETDMRILFETIVERVAPPSVAAGDALQMQVSALDYSSYVGAIGIGRINRGRLRPNQGVVIVDRDGRERRGRVLEVLGFQGLNREAREEAEAGDIVAVTGIDELRISDTLCDPAAVEALPALSVDEPTVSMTFEVSDSPFAGREGRFVTSRQIIERLDRELIHNVALRVEQTADPKVMLVSGRGELHLSILIENMRREGYAFCVGRPQVIVKTIDGVKSEPFEQLVVDVPEEFQGAVMEKLGMRRGQLKNMQSDSQGRVRLDYEIPARGLIGFRTEFLTATSGTGLLFHSFDSFRPLEPGAIAPRKNGVLIANAPGKALGFALFNLQERGRLLVKPGDEIFEGMIVGIHSRDNDLVVNAMKAKQLTNIRAAGNDENILLTPPWRFDLEQALEFIDDDELVEVTPLAIRLRKRELKEVDRKRTQRAAERAAEEVT
ncbi:MAG: translational GTPase TypA [Gammaproteobacteria bacterium]|nr:translational GTPase TypA [Gammaproteobacteria bacterium]MCP5200605.1 translational GTPase TypA [Gammaproteobacteria bacterium]